MITGSQVQISADPKFQFFLSFYSKEVNIHQSIGGVTRAQIMWF
jgi:hypothetical protein